MEAIKINFLGTGSAIPTAKRNHPAILLQYKDETMLFDCGEGTQRQLRKAKINPCKINKIFISHWHADHVLGISGLIQTLMMNEYNKTLEIYGPKNTKKYMQLYLNLFTRKAEQIKIKVHEITSKKILETNEFKIESQELKHDTPTRGYSFTLKEKLRLDKAKLKKLKLPNTPKLAKLAQGKKVQIGHLKLDGKKLTYKEPEKKISIIMDTAYTKSIETFTKNSDLLIIESTYSKDEQEKAKDYLHLTSEQAGKIAKKAKVKQLILTHLSQRYENNPKIILNQAKKIFKNTQLAKDFMKIEI